MEEKKFRNAVSFLGFAKSINAPKIDYYKNPETGNITVMFCDLKTEDVIQVVYCSHAAVEPFLKGETDKLQVVEALNNDGDWMPVVTVNKRSENRHSLVTLKF